MVTIRPLEEHDETEWMRLRIALWPHYSLTEMLKEMAELRRDLEHQPVFVAEAPDGGLCGLMEVAIHTSAPGCTTQRIGYLEAWYVDPAWRKQGIGRRLVDVAEAWSISQGCREMASDTDAGYPLSALTPNSRCAEKRADRSRERHKAQEDVGPTCPVRERNL